MNVTIGQYIPGDTWVYRLDPRIKIILLLLLIVAVFLVPSLIIMAVGLLLMFALIISTRISLIRMLKGLRPLVFLLLFTFVVQVIYVQEGPLLFEQTMTMTPLAFGAIIGLIVLWRLLARVFKFKILMFLSVFILVFVIQAKIAGGPVWFTYDVNIYQSGLERALFLFFRIMLIVLLSTLLTFTTMPTDLNNGLESVMKPLKYVGVNVGVIAMMLSLTLRTIPTLLEETTKIMKAQASRGVDFSESKFKDKVMQVVSLLIPMFVISIRRAEDLANAMEVRGYVIGEPRTKIDLMTMKRLDYLALLLGMLFLVAVIAYRFVV